MDEPLVSVVMPVYNAASYLAASVESVLGQSHARLELIAVDDGSRDASWSMLEQYAARDTRVRALRLPANAGVEPVIRRLRESLIAEHLGVERDDVARAFDRTGSLIETVEALRGDGRSLEWLDLIAPGPLDEYIAENELLDPTSPDAMFESLTERGLRKSWHRGKAWMKRHRPFK